MNASHVFLLLLANPAWCWITWYSSTKKDVSVEGAAQATNAARNDATKEERRANLTLINKGEVDILHLLNLSSGTPGVSVVEGPSPGVPAYKLRVNYGNVRVATPDVITAALTRPPGFTAVFVYRQHRKTLGTLLSVHSPGRLSPWFQLTSNLRTGQLVMHYRITADEKLHQNSWPLQQPIKKNALLAPDQRKAGYGWTHLAVSVDVDAGTVTLIQDCQPPRQQPLAGSTAASSRVAISIPDDALVYFRQEPGFKKKFLGTMQVAKIQPLTRKNHLPWICEAVPKKQHYVTQQ